MISHGNINSSIAQMIITSIAQSEVYTVRYILIVSVSNFKPFFFVAQPPDGIPVILAFLPMHHTYGLNIYAFRSCLAQATLVLMPKWETKLALRAIPKYAYILVFFWAIL